MDKVKPSWKKRGFVSGKEISSIETLSENEIIELLKSKESTKRTAAANILGNRKLDSAIIPLVEALKKEKALYTKIAISEALGKIGKPAANELILLFGKIGNNQHKTLPEKPFEKWNYPLPRDIAARTIIKIGEAALDPILESILNMEKEALSEAIDAIGFISFNGENKSAFRPLINLLNIYKTDDLIVWKIIRSLQSFPLAKTETILNQYLNNHKQPAIRCEAARSLGQICKSIPESLKMSTNDNHELVSKMSLLALERIKTKENRSFQ